MEKRSTVCTRQDLGREHVILRCVTLTPDDYQVSHGVGRCVKTGVVFTKRGVKVNGVLLGYHTISTKY